MYMLMIGTPHIGFKLIGPYDSPQEAETEINSAMPGYTDYHIMPVYPRFKVKKEG